MSDSSERPVSIISSSDCTVERRRKIENTLSRMPEKRTLDLLSLSNKMPMKKGANM
jgi:hypothetical protein